MKSIMLIGGGVGNAVLFSIGKAFLEKKNKVLYFAGYKKLNDVFKQALVELASSIVVWACEEGLIKIRRDQDRSFHGNIVDAIISYQRGMLGNTVINLGNIDKIIVIGSDKMMKAVNEARKTVLMPYLKCSHVAISSVNSPMQCMMKEICAQCVQRHINTETGKESFIYSCSNQDQNMEFVDFDFLSERLMQNSLQEKLTAKWVEHVQRC
ncbi:oxidoreductase [Wolbachia endosymbiont of Cruorifilaria tuberocauda]|uniref:oxidoreductase n=1 Tax=Wolbachia endosymbiont of Cruorifilaria tuberocauda TaxID=1812111 RepID=UPI00158EDEDE|nr:oxidoreductase [Wolbachia endosymbiont of Cruorifilaria tuberocauda]QKX01370.1 oxidoreductase [Wolbachia endosymbiont of Cruorifilaria tuberocauda]